MSLRVTTPVVVWCPTCHLREVFKARCKKTGKMVALKKILMENEKEGVRLLQICSGFWMFDSVFSSLSLLSVK